MSDPAKPITFIRPDPSQFVLLVAKTRGNGIVAGTDNFKPAGCEWATEQDMRDAGYVSLERAKRALCRFAAPPDLETAEETSRAVMQILGIAE
jgi:hypothetical protein